MSEGLGPVLVFAVIAAGIAAWSLRLRVLRGRPYVAARTPPANRLAPVSIIVPARNEAENLPALLDSLARLRPAPLEVIVVDDHSTDETAAVAASLGARVIAAPPLPHGWVGKTWACHAGAAVARGRYLLFTDADTTHAPDSLARALARMHDTGAGVVSAVPRHRIVAGWERLQGIFHLLVLVASGAGRDGSGGRRFANGQYLLFRREAYDRIGGHTCARDRVAEDLAIAAAASRAGVTLTLMPPGPVAVRMYPEGLRSFVRGFRRSFHDGLGAAGAAGALEVSAVIAWLLTAPLWASWAAAAAAWPSAAVWGGAYVATAAEIARRQRHLGTFPRWSSLVYPVFVGLFVAVSAAAALGRARGAPREWKGRTIRT